MAQSASSTRFAQLNLGARERLSPRSAPAARLQPSAAADVAASNGRQGSAAPPRSRAPPSTTPSSLEEVRRRVAGLLDRGGFQPEVGQDGAGYLITGVKMSGASDASALATCGVAVLSRPQMYATRISVRVQPAQPGTRVGIETRFSEVDAGLMSGRLSKRACRSRGLLEAEVRQAARGG